MCRSVVKFSPHVRGVADTNLYAGSIKFCLDQSWDVWIQGDMNPYHICLKAPYTIKKEVGEIPILVAG